MVKSRVQENTQILPFWVLQNKVWGDGYANDDNLIIIWYVYIEKLYIINSLVIADGDWTQTLTCAKHMLFTPLYPRQYVKLLCLLDSQ